MKIISTLRTAFSLALTIASVSVLALLLHVSHFRSQIVFAQQSDYSQVRAEAEQAYASGSYARANEIYSNVNKVRLPPAEARWVEFRLADPSWRAQAQQANQGYFYTYYGNYIPLDILENALKISARENDQAHLHFLIAMTMRVTGGGDWEARERVPDEFEAALKSGKQTDWYDDAL